MLSWPTAGLLGALRAVRRLQPRFGTAARVAADVERTRLRPASYAPPRRLLRRLAVSRTDVEDWPVYRLGPRERPERRVLYLHGGAYVGEVIGLHWAFAAHLATEIPAEVLVPIYPLADRVGAAGVVATGVRLLRDLLADPTPLVVVGDSAGAGLALACTQQLLAREPAGPRPHRLVLVSPWLDARCDDPRQAELARRDPLVRPESLRAAAATYAKGLHLDDPRLSPLLGSFTGLPPITAFSGTADVLHPDSLRLVEVARAAGVEVDLRVLDGGPHEYPILPVPEGRAARWEIVRAVRR